jgi:antitoxin (DNA-binding transcriptional repressor) of toxin-antitoxin stability system
MQIVSAADTKASLSAFIKSSAEELVVITRNGQSVAAWLPIDDALKRLALASSRRFQAVPREVCAQRRVAGGISHDELWRDSADASHADNP